MCPTFDLYSVYIYIFPLTLSLVLHHSTETARVREDHFSYMTPLKDQSSDSVLHFHKVGGVTRDRFKKRMVIIEAVEAEIS